jgi:hypothetical protein
MSLFKPLNESFFGNVPEVPRLEDECSYLKIFGWGCRLGFWVCLKFGGFAILGVTSPKLPAEGRLRPPDPLQTGVRATLRGQGDFLQRSYRFVGAQGFAPLQSCW